MLCDTCTLGYRADGPQVLGAGATTARIAFVAEGPGTTEVAGGEPLIGPTGHWFRTLLGDAGLAWDDVYRTNAICCQAPGKGSELTGPAWTAVGNCSPGLHHECRALIAAGVRVFVAMGNAALQGLLPGAPGIVKARGYVFPWGTWPAAWVVPTLHPSPKNLKGHGGAWMLVVNDMRKAKRIADRGHPAVPPVRRTLYPTLEDLRLFFARPRPLAADVENTLDGRLVCVGYHDGEHTLVVPILKQGGGAYWSPDEEHLVRVGLKLVHQNPAWEFWFQNGAQDCHVLEDNGLGVIARWTLDTMLADHACYPDQLHSLHALGSRFYEGPPWKHTGGGRSADSTAAEEVK